MRLAAIAALAVALSSCGYHRAGNADLIPKSVRTVSVTAWGNATPRFALSSRLPAAVTREFLRRTRYRVVTDPETADAVLTGAVLGFNSFPITNDPTSGRASGIQMIVTLQAKLVERATGKVLFERTSYEVRANYEISVDQAAFFDESGAAVQRLSQDVARSLVSAILENF
jgi:outer membrane lipopolysaccharide assembly protein LptE/RlpB